MPSRRCPEHQFAALRKSALQDVDINRGVVEQLSGLIAGGLNEVEIRLRSRLELRLTFFGFEPPQSRLEIRIQHRPRDSRCRGGSAASSYNRLQPLWSRVPLQ